MHLHANNCIPDASTTTINQIKLLFILYFVKFNF
jgi:hypothetical protein